MAPGKDRSTNSPGFFPGEQAKAGESKSGKKTTISNFSQPEYAPDQGHWTPESFNSIPVKDQPHPHTGPDVGIDEY